MSNNNLFYVLSFSAILFFTSIGMLETTYADVFFSQFGTPGSGDGQFDSPRGIVVDSDGNIYVLDGANYRIQKFNSAGDYQSQFGSQGGTDGKFQAPNTFAIDTSNNLYVVDDGFTERIQKFNSAGEFQSKFGSDCRISDSNGCVDPDDAGPLELGDGQFNNPEGIALDSAGNIYVVDTGNHRIQKFNSAAEFQSKFGSLCALSFGGCVDPDGAGPLESGDGQFNFPRGIAVDSSGNIYVADYQNNRVQKFNSDGVFQLKFGTFGTGDGQFNTPRGIAFDSAGNIYVVDTGNNRIQKFNSDGVFQSKFGTFGTGDGQFNSPRGITIDSFGNIYVADANNHRIQKFVIDCSPPPSGDWTVTISCIMIGNETINNGDLIVQSNSVLTIPNGVTLTIDFTTYNLTVQSGSGILIKSGGKIT